jgi:hypothetical protein
MANQVDPRLLTAIRTSKSPVQAIVTLRSTRDGQPLTPEDTASSVKQMVERAVAAVPGTAKRIKVFPNLQSFSIEADADVVQQLLEEEEVDTASLNAKR